MAFCFGKIFHSTFSVVILAKAGGVTTEYNFGKINLSKK